MKNLILNLAFLVFGGILTAQSSDSTHYEPDSYFQKSISKYEGLPAPLFEAPDIDGNVHFLDRYLDHIVILHFCQIYSEPSVSQIPSLNRIVEEYFDKGVSVFGFAMENTQDIREFLKNQKVNYPIIPNSMEFSIEHYGGGLGYPRAFLIDKYGIVQKVTIGGKSGDYMELYNRLTPIIEEHLKY